MPRTINSIKIILLSKLILLLTISDYSLAATFLCNDKQRQLEQMHGNISRRAKDFLGFSSQRCSYIYSDYNSYRYWGGENLYANPYHYYEAMEYPKSEKQYNDQRDQVTNHCKKNERRDVYNNYKTYQAIMVAIWLRYCPTVTPVPRY